MIILNDKIKKSLDFFNKLKTFYNNFNIFNCYFYLFLFIIIFLKRFFIIINNF